MNDILQKKIAKISSSKTFTIVLYALIVLFMGSINAIADKFIRPDIPLLSAEHLLAGGLTSILTILIYGALLSHLYHQRMKINRIMFLESILPICSNCKKIRDPRLDPRLKDSWESIEKYLTEKTRQSLTHGICPECLSRLYPEYIDILKVEGACMIKKSLEEGKCTG